MSGKSRTRKSPVLLDSSPFLLLLIGNYNLDLIGKAKRLKEYKPIDFEMLVQFLAGRKIIVTPGILAEVSNLSRYCVGAKRYGDFLEKIIPKLMKIGEVNLAKEIIIKNPAFQKIGYTDSSIMEAGKHHNFEILTSDYQLYSRCSKSGLKVNHMNMLREAWLNFT